MGSETGKNTWKKRKDATPANILLGNNLIRKASDDIKSIFQEFLGGFRSKMIALYLQQTVAVAALFGSLGIVYSTVTAQQTLPASSIGTSAVPWPVLFVC